MPAAGANSTETMATSTTSRILVRLLAVAALAAGARAQPLPPPADPRGGPPAAKRPDSDREVDPPKVTPPVEQEATYRGPKIRLPLGARAGAYLLTEQRQIRQTIFPDGGKQENWQSLTVSGDLVIAPPDPGGRTQLSFSCARIEQTLSLAGKERRFDSSAPGAGQDADLLALWGPTKGWTGRRLTTADGRTETLEGLAGLAIASTLGPAGAEHRQRRREFATGLLDELGVGWWGQLVPGEAVAPGSRWQVTVYLPTEPVLSIVKIPCHCLLQDIVTESGRKVAVIDFTGSAAIDSQAVDPAHLLLLPLQVQVRRLKLSMAGSLRMDLAAGVAGKLKVSLQGQGQMSIRDGKGPGVMLGITFQSDRGSVAVPIPPDKKP